MASCSVRIELERPGAGEERPHFRGGDEIAGEVIVNTDEAVECKGVQVKLRHLVHGKGNRRRIDTETAELFRGTLSGGTVRLPFRFVLPNGPVSYQGHLLNVDWMVHATVDIPWKLDPKVDCEFSLEADSAAPYAVQAEEQAPAVVRRQMSPGCGLLFLLPFLVVGAGLGYWGWRDGELLMMIFGALFGGIAIFMMVVMTGKILAARRLGELRVQLSHEEARPGDEVTLTVGCRPVRETMITGFSGKLVAKETVVKGSGTNKSTHRKKLYEEEFELPWRPRRLRSGEHLSAQATFRVPADAAPTFHAHENHLRWMVHYRLEIDRWPDHREEVELLVRP